MRLDLRLNRLEAGFAGLPDPHAPARYWHHYEVPQGEGKPSRILFILHSDDEIPNLDLPPDETQPQQLARLNRF